MTSRDARAVPPADLLDGPLPQDATPEQQALYTDIAAHLRVPYSGPFWRALCLDPAWFTPVWRQLGPLMRTAAFEREAAALRHFSLIEEAAEMSSHQAFKADLVRAEIDYDMRERIGNFNAAVHYALAKTLLAAATLARADRSIAGAAVEPDAAIPLGIAAGAVPVTPVPPAETREALAAKLDQIQQAHQHPIVDEYFRALGRIPDYLGIAWNAIRPVVRDEPYDDRAAALAARAAEAAGRLPQLHISTASDRDGATDRAAVIRYFATFYLPDVLVDVAIVTALTYGPDRALESPFDLGLLPPPPAPPPLSRERGD